MSGTFRMIDAPETSMYGTGETLRVAGAVVHRVYWRNVVVVEIGDTDDAASIEAELYRRGWAPSGWERGTWAGVRTAAFPRADRLGKVEPFFAKETTSCTG